MRNDRKLAEFGSKPVLLTVMGAGLFFVQFKSSRFSSSTVWYGGWVRFDSDLLCDGSVRPGGALSTVVKFDYPYLIFNENTCVE